MEDSSLIYFTIISNLLFIYVVSERAFLEVKLRVSIGRLLKSKSRRSEAKRKGCRPQGCHAFTAIFSPPKEVLADT